MAAGGRAAMAAAAPCSGARALARRPALQENSAAATAAVKRRRRSAPAWPGLPPFLRYREPARGRLGVAGPREHARRLRQAARAGVYHLFETAPGRRREDISHPQGLLPRLSGTRRSIPRRPRLLCRGSSAVTLLPRSRCPVFLPFLRPSVLPFFRSSVLPCFRSSVLPCPVPVVFRPRASPLAGPAVPPPRHTTARGLPLGGPWRISATGFNFRATGVCCDHGVRAAADVG
jgi:hypothetical protein